MGITGNVLAAIKKIYASPKFFVDIEGTLSDQYRQSTGIRQGCPLSPYLFIITMTALFHDIHHDPEKLEPSRPPETSFDEVLFADDTICVSTSAEGLNGLVHRVDQHSQRYGVAVNKGKCELINFGVTGSIHFNNGKPILKQYQAKYLGCTLNEKGDTTSELNKRISDCHRTWRRLELFWKHSDCTSKLKLQVWNAIIRSKVMYGMTSAQLNQGALDRLDAFQLKGIRQILNITTTYGQSLQGAAKTNTNDQVYAQASATVYGGASCRRVKPLSEIYKDNRLEAYRTPRTKAGFQRKDSPAARRHKKKAWTPTK